MSDPSDDDPRYPYGEPSNETGDDNPPEGAAPAEEPAAELDGVATNLPEGYQPPPTPDDHVTPGDDEELDGVATNLPEGYQPPTAEESAARAT